MTTEVFNQLIVDKNRVDRNPVSIWSQEDINLMIYYHNMFSKRPYPTTLTCKDCAVKDLKAKITIFINERQRQQKRGY